jgi:hypothetical protein
MPAACLPYLDATNLIGVSAFLAEWAALAELY